MARKLMLEILKTQVQCSGENFKRKKTNQDYFKWQLITGVETWIHQYELKTKEQFIQLCILDTH